MYKRQVINIGALKDGRFDYIQQELIILSTLCHRNRAILKVILETGLLTEKEIRTACILAERSGADFVKTSTGFNGPGATVEAVKLMKDVYKRQPLHYYFVSTSTGSVANISSAESPMKYTV